MMRRLPVLVLALVAVIGCGGDDERRARELPAAPPSTAPTTPAASPAPEPKDTRSLRADALRNCRGQARSTTGLSAEARRRTTRICDAAAGRSAGEIRRAARRACIVVAEDTTARGAPERDAKLENCDFIS